MLRPSITFFGTHDFGAAMLEALISSDTFDITAVVTQPDRPAGRGNEIQESAVKKIALEHNLPIFQPESLKNEISDFRFQISTDVFVVCQYGLIIPQWVLDLPKRGTINVHTSLLPKYRGASPIQTALLNGASETGLTIMLMDAKMDHGAILSQEKIAITPDQTYPELSARLEPVAAHLLVTTLNGWLKHEIDPIEQDHEAATFCKLFTREDGKVDFTKTAEQIYNQYRGLTPWPGIWTMWNGKRIKLLVIARSEERTTKQSPGFVFLLNEHIYIICGKGTIEVLQLQLEGKKAMNVKEFLNGYTEIESTILPN